MGKLLVVLGTRPEAIKLFPVIHALRAYPHVDLCLCSTGQHRDLLDPIWDLAGLTPDIDLDIMVPDQSLDELTARLLVALGQVMDAERPDRLLVQGDTVSAMTAAMAAHYRHIPVAHVEAGLRSGNLHHPWPEEMNRRYIAIVSDLHFAPTESAARALQAEGTRDGIHVTGNSVIDALLAVRERLHAGALTAPLARDLATRFPGRRIIAVTSHRRENWGEGMAGIAAALRTLAHREDVAIVFPLHPNPQVRAPMAAALAGLPNVLLLEPLGYADFVALLDACHLVLTDSGGVQEEAPALGKLVLVLRETTERPEGIAAGVARLVGTDPERILAEAARLLDDPSAYAATACACSPYGDGRAAQRIAHLLAGDALPIVAVLSAPRRAISGA